MSVIRTTRAKLGGACAALALGLALVGCGGGSSGGGSSSTTASNATTAAAATKSSAAVAPRLLILTPRRGSHTGQSLTVRVRLSGANPTGGRAFRYLLDGRLARLGSARLTYHELAPGRHRLLVMLAADARVRAGSFFVVLAPAPVVTPESPPTMATTPTTTETGPAPTPAPSHTTTQPPTPAPRETPPTTGIPQNNGGDHDSDNNGGPSDGDGNI